MPVSRAAGQPRTLVSCLLHIAALNACAIAQPVFDRLGANPQYLRLEDFSGAAIGVSLSFFLLAIPLATIGLMAVLKRLKHPKAASVVFGTVATILVVLCVNLFLRWIQWRFQLRSAGVPDVFLFAVSFPLAMGCGWLYRRWQWPGQFLNVAAIGNVLFPLSLLSLPAMQAEILGVRTRNPSAIHAKNPVPIVMIAFDGLCGMSLLNERHDIDAVRYPSFARLASQSRFYRNATSVHARTTQAMPAILTGQLPEWEKRSPVESNHPDNLFRLIHNTEQYEMTVFEPMTRLCPSELRQLDQTLSFPRQAGRLTAMLARVYIHTSLPTDFDSLQPEIPRSWFGIVADEARQERPSRGLVTYGWDVEHALQVSHFTRCLQKTQKPGFYFLHVVIPHDPWSHLPSGKEYAVGARISEHTTGTTGDLGEHWCADELFVNLGWQRYLLQLQFADRCLGKIMDQLESINEFDRALIIVVADHGMAFIPSEERRTPSNNTFVDLMSVPLLIKLPGQSTGESIDRNVETIDVLPTVADILQMPLPGVVDGTSIVDPNFRERPRKLMYYGNDDEVMVIGPDFPQRFHYVDRMLATFGSGSQDDRLWSLDTIPELLGRNIAEFNIGTASRWKCLLDHGGEDLNPDWPDFVPSYFSGRLSGPTLVQPVQIAIAVNGRIQGTTRSSTDPGMSDRISALLREEVFAEESVTVQFFEVQHTGDSWVLHEVSHAERSRTATSLF